jgi:hypothetical protein
MNGPELGTAVNHLPPEELERWPSPLALVLSAAVHFVVIAAATVEIPTRYHPGKAEEKPLDVDIIVSVQGREMSISESAVTLVTEPAGKRVMVAPSDRHPSLLREEGASDTPIEHLVALPAVPAPRLPLEEGQLSSTAGKQQQLNPTDEASAQPGPPLHVQTQPPVPLPPSDVEVEEAESVPSGVTLVSELASEGTVVSPSNRPPDVLVRERASGTPIEQVAMLPTALAPRLPFEEGQLSPTAGEQQRLNPTDEASAQPGPPLRVQTQPPVPLPPSDVEVQGVPTLVYAPSLAQHLASPTAPSSFVGPEESFGDRLEAAHFSAQRVRDIKNTGDTELRALPSSSAVAMMPGPPVATSSPRYDARRVQPVSSSVAVTRAIEAPRWEEPILSQVSRDDGPEAHPLPATAASAPSPGATRQRPPAIGSPAHALMSEAPPAAVVQHSAAPPPEGSLPAIGPSSAPLAAIANEPTQVAAIAQLPRSVALGIDPLERAEAVTSGYGCAKVETRYDVSNGALTASGYVRSTNDRTTIVNQLSKINGLGSLETADLRVVGEPYCQLMLLFDRPEFVRSPEQRADMLEVGNPQHAGIRGMPAGTLLEFEFRAPNFRNHMYVDYFMSNGRVYHLLPTESISGNQFLPNARFKIGGPGTGRRIWAAPPLGVDVVVSIGSSAKLFQHVRPRIETASDYLFALMAALDRAQQRHTSLRIEYSYHLVDTRPHDNR